MLSGYLSTFSRIVKFSFITLLSASLFCSCSKVDKEVVFNGDIEVIQHQTRSPFGWVFLPQEKKSNLIGLDSIETNTGKYSLLISQNEQISGLSLAKYKINKTFRGSEIELKGYIKTKNVLGMANMYIIINGRNGPIERRSLGAHGPKNSTQWQQYSIKLPYSSGIAVSIEIGAQLYGNGKAWFDNIELLIDGRSIEKAEVIQNNTALNEKLISPKLDTVIRSQQTITNLTLACQLWGFLKYFHPAVAKGGFDWDAELLKALPSLMKAENNVELSFLLEKFVDGLSNVKRNPSVKESTNFQIVQRPDFGYLAKEGVLSKSLLRKIQFIIDNRNTGASFYFRLDAKSGNPIFLNEDPYIKMTYPLASYRLLSLFRYWAIINYFYPYKNQIGQDWNGILPKFIPMFLQAKTKQEYVLTTLKLITSINDTHANIYQNTTLEAYRGFNITPFKAKFVENQLVVSGFFKDTLSVKEKVRVGDIVTKINGKDIQGLVNYYYPITAGSNREARLRDMPDNYLLRSNSKNVKFSFRRGSHVFTTSMPMINIIALFQSKDFNGPGFFLINKNIGYIFAGRYHNSDLYNIKEKFSETHSLIIDMRCYPSDFMPISFGMFIKALPTAFAKIGMVDSDYPGLFYINRVNSNGGGGSVYKGKVLVLVNELTQSQGEYTVMSFQGLPNVKTVGSTTAGADGNVSSLLLPGGIRTMISGIGIFYPDGNSAQRTGVRIDYNVKPTIKGIAEGKDEVLLKALSLLQ